jgi:ribosome maturation factor RimP
MRGLAAVALKPASELLESLGFELVTLEAAGSSGTRILRFTVDRPPPPPLPAPSPPYGDGGCGSSGGFVRGSQVTLDDCAGLSRELSNLLDGLWPGDGGPEYLLEVSSPGLDRQLVSEAELVRFSGSLAKLRLRRGERTEVITGRLRCSPGGLAILPAPPPARPGRQRRPEPGLVVFTWDEVRKARLVPEF